MSINLKNLQETSHWISLSEGGMGRSALYYTYDHNEFEILRRNMNFVITAKSQVYSQCRGQWKLQMVQKRSCLTKAQYESSLPYSKEMT